MFAFRLGRIPVRVHFVFFLMTGMLGGGQSGPKILSWIAVVFVSVIIHELGHALMGKLFGLTPEIDLHGMGGTTSWSAAVRLSPARHILISLAGPLAGLACGLVVIVATRDRPLTQMQADVVGQIIWVNVGWGLLNLIPILPLDGGNVLARLLDMATGGKGARPAHFVSAALAGIIIVYLLASGGLTSLMKGQYHVVWPMLLAGMFLAQNVRALRPPPDEDRL